jgi:hypothetical protein
MPFKKLIFRIHAVKRMFQRNISEEDIRFVSANGEVIEEYPEDIPYPSRLVSGWSGTRPIHIVLAENQSAGETIVITVYEPEPDYWEPGFTRRKKK